MANFCSLIEYDIRMAGPIRRLRSGTRLSDDDRRVLFSFYLNPLQSTRHFFLNFPPCKLHTRPLDILLSIFSRLCFLCIFLLFSPLLAPNPLHFTMNIHRWDQQTYLHVLIAYFNHFKEKNTIDKVMDELHEKGYQFSFDALR